MSEQLPAVSIEVAEFWAANGARKERERIIEMIQAFKAEQIRTGMAEHIPASIAGVNSILVMLTGDLKQASLKVSK